MGDIIEKPVEHTIYNLKDFLDFVLSWGLKFFE